MGNPETAKICSVCDAERPEVPFEVEITQPDQSQHVVLVSGGKQSLSVLRGAVAKNLGFGASQVCLTIATKDLCVDSKTLAQCGITPDNNQIVASKRDLHAARRLQEAAQSLKKEVPAAQSLKREVSKFLAEWVAELLACSKLREFAPSLGAVSDRTDVQNVEICEMLNREAENDVAARKVDDLFEQGVERIQQKIRPLEYSIQLRSSADAAWMGSTASSGYR